MPAWPSCCASTSRRSPGGSGPKDTGKLEYSELIGELFAIGRKHHVHPIPDMTLVFVALITAQGIGMMLGPGHNIFATVAQFPIPDPHEAQRAGARHCRGASRAGRQMSDRPRDRGARLPAGGAAGDRRGAISARR